MGGFYERLFNFSEIRYFDIQGQKTGLRVARNGKPRREDPHPHQRALGRHSQIQEYLSAYRGEGIQHIALATMDIHTPSSQLRSSGVKFMDVPETYYDAVEGVSRATARIWSACARTRILIDGATNRAPAIVQIFTETVIGPIFFEIISGKGTKASGEGNFQALFEAIEREQMRRGVI